MRRPSAAQSVPRQRGGASHQAACRTGRVLETIRAVKSAVKCRHQDGSSRGVTGGTAAGVPTIRAEIRDQPLGFNALVLGTDDADATRTQLQERGLAADPPLDFSRPVTIGGQRRDARFRTVRAAAEPPPFGRLYFCEHLTRDLVWRDEWRAHGNGALAIARAVIASAEPRRSARYFATLLGAGAVAEALDRYDDPKEK